MRKEAKTQQIIKYLQTNPGRQQIWVAEIFGVSRQLVSHITKELKTNAVK